MLLKLGACAEVSRVLNIAASLLDNNTRTVGGTPSASTHRGPESGSEGSKPEGTETVVAETVVAETVVAETVKPTATISGTAADPAATASGTLFAEVGVYSGDWVPSDLMMQHTHTCHLIT